MKNKKLLATEEYQIQMSTILIKKSSIKTLLKIIKRNVNSTIGKSTQNTVIQNQKILSTN